jgi:hypothetical protein
MPRYVWEIRKYKHITPQDCHNHQSNSVQNVELGKAGVHTGCEVNYFVTCFYDIIILI